MNDRISMPGAMPAEIAERMSDTGRELTDAELAAAKEALIDDFITHGIEIGDWSLADFIDLEINAEPRRFAERLAAVGGGLFKEGGACFVMALDEFYRGIVAKHLPEDLITERAMEE